MWPSVPTSKLNMRSYLYPQLTHYCMGQSSLDPWIKELYIHSFTSFYGISIFWVGDFTFFFQRHCHLEVKLGSAGSFADLPSFDSYFFPTL